MVTEEMLKKLDEKMQIRFAIFCAKQVFDLIKEEDKSICLKAIEAAEGFIEGKITKEECLEAANAANVAAYAAYAAANAAYAAYSAYAAYAAAANAANAAGAAANAAYAAAANAANAAGAAANAAYAAGAANKKEVQLQQLNYYNELLNFDQIVEGIIGV